MIKLFRVFIPKSVVALVLLDVVLVYACFITASYWFLGESAALFLFYDDGLAKISLAVASVILAVYFQNIRF